MLSSLHPEVLRQTEAYRAEFLAAQPFRHVMIEPFLDPVLCQQLIGQFPAFHTSHAVDDHGTVGLMAAHAEIRSLGDACAAFDGLMSDPEFLALVSRITDISDLLYDPQYLGGGTHENLDGQELDPHVDFNFHSSTHFHRRLNLIVFLNPEWDESWGGCLELSRNPHAAEAGSRRSFAPLANRAVIFETTEASWHGFQRIRIPPGRAVSRRSIAVYYYTKDRPAAQTEVPHGTVYYQRSMPEHLQAGYRLTQEDVDEMWRLLVRRDTQLQFLYQRELEFARRELELRQELKEAGQAIQGLNQTVASVLGSVSFKLGRALTSPMRLLRGVGRRRGLPMRTVANATRTPADP